MKLVARPKGLRDLKGQGLTLPLPPVPPKNVERLASVAIKRNGQVHHGFRAHWELRHNLGDEKPERPLPADENGFWTSEGRFVSRWEASDIGRLSGQITQQTTRELLSSDINWDR